MNKYIVKVNGLNGRVIGEVTDWKLAEVPKEIVELADVPAVEYVPGNCTISCPISVTVPKTRRARRCWWEDDTLWVEYADGVVEGYEKATITDMKWELNDEKDDGPKPSVRGRAWNAGCASRKRKTSKR